MAINYAGIRLFSADATALMRRINALENVVISPTWEETWTEWATGQFRFITSDQSGFIYTGFSGSVINKLAYGGGSDVLPLIPNGTGTGEIDGITDMDANESALWVAYRITGDEGYLKKFDLDGSELFKIDNSVPDQGAYKFVSVGIFADGGVAATQKFRTAGGDLQFRIITYDSGGSAETVIYTQPKENIGTQDDLVELEITSGDDIVVHHNLGDGVPDEARVYSRSGSLLDVISADDYLHVHYGYADNKVLAYLGGQENLVSLYQLDGTFIEDVFENTTGGTIPTDVTVDENGRLYWARDDGRIFVLEAIEGGGTGTQTTFYRYPNRGLDTNSESLGTPNGGASVPASGALLTLNSGERHRPHAQELNDMRDALESVAPSYKNGVTGNPFTLSPSADNIFSVAFDDAGQDDWTSPTVTSTINDNETSRMKAIDMSDIDLVLIELEASDLV